MDGNQNQRATDAQLIGAAAVDEAVAASLVTAEGFAGPMTLASMDEPTRLRGCSPTS